MMVAGMLFICLCNCIKTICVLGADFADYEQVESLPRPEEERLTEAEKNERMKAQLKVNCWLKTGRQMTHIGWFFFGFFFITKI